MIKTIDVYLGHLHLSPISRLWNTQSSLMGLKDNKEAQNEKKLDSDEEDEEER
jgi:hypothetical protein